MTLVIAEAGVNHNGDEDLAFELVDEAVKAGADIVKFQTFKAKNLVTEQAPQADYQVKNTQKQESQFDMLSRLELSFDAHKRLLTYCNSKGIEFLSTAFDSESLHFLCQQLGVKRLKIPSGELTNAPLLLEHAEQGLQLIVSTGMATLADIENALGVIAFGYLKGSHEKAGLNAFSEAYASREGRQILKEKVTLLHCTTEYPAPDLDINLNAMETLAATFKLPVGYSDHSEGIVVPIAAVAKGACVLEKHFTLDRNLPGPDHKASLEPQELKLMIDAVRQTQRVLGDGIKRPTPSELKNRPIARKSLVAARDIALGEAFSADNLAAKRPGTGISPFQFWRLLGKGAVRGYKAGELIDE